MSSEFLSPFKLVKSAIDSISFESIDSSLEIGTTELTLGHYFDENELRTDEIWAIKGGLSVECEWQCKDGTPICRGACTIKGAVSVFKAGFGDDLPDGELELLLKANLVSLLYGEARSSLGLLSSNTESGKRLLPSIDPFAYLSQELEEG